MFALDLIVKTDVNRILNYASRNNKIAGAIGKISGLLRTFSPNFEYLPTYRKQTTGISLTPARHMSSVIQNMYQD